MPCNDEKHIFAIYWALQYDMYMCIYRKVEDDLPVFLKSKTPSFVPKTLYLRLNICDLTSSSWTYSFL